MENNNSFEYSYSSREQAEVRKIRDKYIKKDEDKLTRLRRLDASATEWASVWSLAVGVIGTLVMGLGMSCCMVFGAEWFIPGIIIGIAGIALVASAYPIYNFVLKNRRQRIAPEILALTDELMK